MSLPSPPALDAFLASVLRNAPHPIRFLPSQSASTVTPVDRWNERIGTETWLVGCPVLLRGDHWVLFIVDFRKSEVRVYDSMVLHAYSEIDPICAKLGPGLRIRRSHSSSRAPLSEQEDVGSNDCCLYVLRNAIGEAFGARRVITRKDLVLAKKDPNGIVSLPTRARHTAAVARFPLGSSSLPQGLAYLDMAWWMSNQKIRHRMGGNEANGVMLRTGRYISTRDMTAEAMRVSGGQPYVFRK